MGRTPLTICCICIVINGSILPGRAGMTATITPLTFISSHGVITIPTLGWGLETHDDIRSRYSFSVFCPILHRKYVVSVWSKVVCRRISWQFEISVWLWPSKGESVALAATFRGAGKGVIRSWICSFAVQTVARLVALRNCSIAGWRMAFIRLLSTICLTLDVIVSPFAYHRGSVRAKLSETR